VFEMARCRVCKKRMVVVRAVGKLRSVEVGHYCFKCKRLVQNKENVKAHEVKEDDEII